MTEINSLVGGISTFAALMVGVSIATERMVEMIKGAIPFLSNSWSKNDQARAALLQLLAATIGAVIASLMPDQVRSAMPPGLVGQLHWQEYAVIGLLASGGSGAWNHVLDILRAFKSNQETAAATARNLAKPQAAAKVGA
jgi:hypothetical protein